VSGSRLSNSIVALLLGRLNCYEKSTVRISLRQGWQPTALGASKRRGSSRIRKNSGLNASEHRRGTVVGFARIRVLMPQRIEEARR
jgi:hypothetical protein